MDAVSGRERCTVVRWEDGRLFGWLLGWLGCSNGPVGHGGYRGTVTERVGAGDRLFDGGVHRAAALAERELPAYTARGGRAPSAILPQHSLFWKRSPVMKESSCEGQQ